MNKDEASIIDKKNIWWINLNVVSKDNCNNNIKSKTCTEILSIINRGNIVLQGQNEKGSPSMGWGKTSILKLCRRNSVDSIKNFFISDIFFLKKLHMTQRTGGMKNEKMRKKKKKENRKKTWLNSS